MLYADASLRMIDSSSPYIAPDGTQYPGSYPKDSIPGLERVIETDPPSDPTVRMIGSHVAMISGRPTQVWDVSPIPLAEIKEAALERAASVRDQRLTTRFMAAHPGTGVRFPMACSPTDVVNWQALTLAALLGRSVTVYPDDGEPGSAVTLSAAEYLAVAAELSAAKQAVWAHAAALEAMIGGADTPAAVAAIMVNAGWPE